MIIDGHAHSSGDFHDVERVIERLDALGVDKVVMCPGAVNDDKNVNFPPVARYVTGADVMLGVNRVIRTVKRFKPPVESLAERNELVHRFHERYPERIVHFYWADPAADDFLEDLAEKHEAWGFSGIKLHQCFESFRGDAPGLHEMAAFAADRDLPVFIHPYSGDEVSRLMGLMASNVRTTFIIAHLIGMERVAASPRFLNNVYFEISPWQLVSECRVLRAIELFGADSVLLGSDTPHGKKSLERNLERVKGLDIPAGKRDLILGKNMERVLGYS